MWMKKKKQCGMSNKTSPHIKESQLQRQIMDYLRLKKCVVVKFRAVGIKKANGSFIPLPAGEKGVSDLLFCTPDGRFGACEVKIKGNKPTQNQLDYLESIRKHKGIAILAYSLDDVIKMI